MKLEWRDMSIGNSIINTSLTAAETAELQRLAAGKDVLEVGSAFGYSTVALGMVANSVTAVDPHVWLNSHDTLVANLEANRVADKVTVIRSDSRTGLPQLVDAGVKYDVIFVDGDHAAEVVASDIDWAVKLLGPRGILALHDLDEVTCPGVRAAVDQFGQPDYVIDTLAVYVELASS